MLLQQIDQRHIGLGHRGSPWFVVEVCNSTITDVLDGHPRSHRKRGAKVHHVLGHYRLRREEQARVPACLITFDRNRYSVPASFANRPVSLHFYPERLVIVAEGHVICTHERIIERSHHRPGRVIYDWRHYLAVVQRKPGALRPSRPIASC